MATSILHLTVDKGPKKGENLNRKPGTLIRIGRVIKGNTFAIKDPGISQKHLVIKFLPEICRWAIEDLDTSNGTLINDVKIASSVPFPLSDGDTIKIGESTSISVKIGGGEAEIGREDKNVPDPKGNVGNRRGRSKKADETVDLVVKEEKCEDSKRIVGSRRGRPKKAEATVGVVEKNEIFDFVVEDSIEKPQNLGRARPRRGTSRVAMKAEVLDVVAKDQVEEPQNLRRGRSRRGGDSCKITKEDEVSDLVLEDNVEVLVEQSKNLRRGRGRKDETSKVSKEDEVSDLVVGDNMPKDTRRTRLRRAPARSRASTATSLVEEDVPEANMEAIEMPEKGKQDEGSDGDNQCKVAGSGKEAEFGGVEEERIVDIETMTLGEWFDSMEKFLPMAINDIAEEIISNLREKARRFDEFIGESSDSC